MRRILVLVVLMLLLPAVGVAGRGYDYDPPPPPHAYDGPRYRPHHDYSSSHSDHRDAWVPLALLGGVLGIIALSQMEPAENTPAPPRRICRDTYNYYDEYGNYLYSRYVDRPCND